MRRPAPRGAGYTRRVARESSRPWRRQVATRVATAALALALILAVSASAAPAARPAAAASAAAARPHRAAACHARPATAAVPGWPTGRVAWRAQPQRQEPLRIVPGGRERRGAGLDAEAPWLLVLGTGSDRHGDCWVRVRLPGRPNDAAGWLPRSAVALQPTPWRIEVSRAARTVTLTRGGRRVVAARVVIGKQSTRTPGGLFAVFNAWPNSPKDFSGSWIVALTAHSRALRRFDGGEGRIAIHGRGGASLADPLGSARSHGCVRVANGDLDRIVRTIGWASLPGTPVRIR